MYFDTVTAAPAALTYNPLHPAPADVLANLVLIRFKHWNFSGQIAVGHITVNKIVAPDVCGFLRLAYELRFPIHKAVSTAYYGWSDVASCEANNSSGFNWRPIDENDWTVMSKHAYGLAFDINPMLNPCWQVSADGLSIPSMIPNGASYDPRRPGTLYKHHPLVRYLVERGWSWGGGWGFPLDLQHFQIVPESMEHLFP